MNEHKIPDEAVESGRHRHEFGALAQPDVIAWVGNEWAPRSIHQQDGATEAGGIFRRGKLYRTSLQFARNLDDGYSWSRFTTRDHRQLISKGKKP